MAAPPDEGGALAVVEFVLGVIYFLAWSASFYPQTQLMFRRGTTTGLSIDYMLINLVGFLSYSVYTFASFYNVDVTEAYVRHTGVAPQVDLSDVLFASHGTLLCSVIIALLVVLPPRLPPSPAVAAASALGLTTVVAGCLASSAGALDWFKYLEFAGLVKVAASLVKHFPQAFLNRRRQSTVGWSFTTVSLDIVGGLFSLAQQVVRCFRIGSAAPFTSNLAKTFLAAETLAFDFFFTAQHLLWYTDRSDFERLARKWPLTPSADVGISSLAHGETYSLQ